MIKKSTVLLGKLARSIARVRGGGSALPGLVVERLDPKFLAHALGTLPRGVIVISGTNGKTTTTKMVSEILRGAGLKVFTNRTGSNFTRGVTSAILGEMRGFKLDADVAVLELDEAHAVQFVKQIAPSFVLILNVLRDQLDRFGEIDKTAKLLLTVAESASQGVILNRDDPLVANIAAKLDPKVNVKFFGYDPNLATKFPSDDELYRDEKRAGKKPNADVELVAFKANHANYRIGGKNYDVDLRLNGAHNILNAAAAIETARAVVPNVSIDKIFDSLSKVEPAFGRGETIKIGGAKLELVLVKNPSGFRLSLASQYSRDAATMIAINDHYADGRDMSWLWDVDFRTIQNVAVVSGIRAYDMALRLRYDDVKFDHITPNLGTALDEFLKKEPTRDKQIFCTYTAMLYLRKRLERAVNMEAAL